MNKIEQAKEMAFNAHGEQKYGEHPYSYHLQQVSDIVEPYGEEAQVVGWLHDIVEDTAVTVDQIGDTFGARIAFAVLALTDPLAPNRKLRKQAANEKLSKIDHKGNNGEELALLVKVADRIANVTECIKDKNLSLFSMYKEEHADFHAAVYRAGFNDKLMDVLDGLFIKGIEE